MKQVLRHPRSLRLPVEPEASRAVVNVVAAENAVDCRMHLDAADLGTGQVLAVVDVVDVVVLNNRENAAEVSDDTGLPAVMNIAAADDVASDVFFEPALTLRLDDVVALRLRAVLELIGEPAVVIVRLFVFTERNAAALGIGDLAVLDNPAPAPMRADHALLISSRRRPLRCGLLHRESGERDVVHVLLLRIEAVFADIDLDILLVRVRTLKIRVENGAIILLILLCVPCENGEVRVPGGLVDLGLYDFGELRHLIHGLAVEIDLAGVCDEEGDEPVPGDQRGVRIVIPED